MPDATPAELMTPSSTTRCSRSTVTPASRASRVPKAPQCVVACRPWRSPCLGEEERAGAHRGDLPRPRCRPTDPVERLDVMEERAGPPPARHDHEVGLGRVGEPVVGDDPKTTGRADRRRGLGDREDVERRAVVRAARFRARHEPRPREDLEGTGEVEDLDVVENQNAGVPLLHLTLLEERITRQPRRISHKQAGSHSQKGKRRIRGPPLSQEPGLVSLPIR